MNSDINSNVQKKVNLGLYKINTNRKIVVPQPRIDPKINRRDLIYLDEKFFKEKHEIGIIKCLGPMILIGIISWLIILCIIYYLI